MKKFVEKIRTKAIEELLCLPPNEEPPQDLASIISDSFSDIFYEETYIITSDQYEDKKFIFLLVNDMNSGLAYLCDVDLMVLCILILIIHACLTLILFN